LIHYHGGPITPEIAAIKAWTARHAMVSFAESRQIATAAEVSQSFALDNGAFSMWKSGVKPDWKAYADWVDQWWQHPGFDWAIIPDVIDGTEADNDALIESWDLSFESSVPVWHLHEDVQRLKQLVQTFHRVALGSSGEYSQPGSAIWWVRMGEAMKVACDEEGRPLAKLHGLRMLDPTIFSQLPLSSADSTNVARNIGIDQAWKGTYLPASKETRAMILAERIERHASASRWNTTTGAQQNLELIG
jgi:hypothetical protein